MGQLFREAWSAIALLWSIWYEEQIRRLVSKVTRILVGANCGSQLSFEFYEDTNLVESIGKLLAYPQDL